MEHALKHYPAHAHGEKNDQGSAIDSYSTIPLPPSGVAME
jgi:hypothetical protein